MKLQSLTLMTASLAVVLTGCVTPSGEPDRTGTGALAGGAIGATSGALIGSGRGHAGEGALIGGAIGAITGGLIGHSMDQEQQERLRQRAPQTYARVDQGQPLSVADIKALAGAGIGDEVIISQIRNSHTVFHLTSADIIDLHHAGVTEKVIDFMINTPSQVGAVPGAAPAPQPSASYVPEAPPRPPVETIVVAPGPGYVWIGGEWMWNGRWIWRAGHWARPPWPHAVWVGGGWYRAHRGWHRTPGHWR